MSLNVFAQGVKVDNATLKVNVNALVKEPCSITLQIEVPAEEAQTVYNKVEKQFAAKVSIPGFRPGKTPIALLRRHYGDRITLQATDELISQGYDSALVSENLKDRLVGSPKLTDDSASVKYEFGKPMAFNVDIEVMPEFDLPAYKGLKLTRKTFEIKEEDVDKQIEYYLQMSVRYEKSEEAAKAEDILTLAYEAHVPEDVTIPENYASIVKNEQSWYPLRTPENLPGAMAALLGKKTDEECDADITFPEDFHLEALRGKTLNYHFKIKEIRTQIKPELNDEFVQRFGAKDLADFRELVKKQIEHEKESSSRSEMIEQITKELYKDLSFPLPPKELERVAVQCLSGMIEDEKRKGTSREDLSARKDEMQAEANKSAADILHKQYILDALIKAEKIEFTDKDFRLMMLQFMRYEAGSKNIQQIMKEKRENGEMNRYISNELYNKLFSRLIELAEVTDLPAEETKQEEAQK